MRSISRDKTPVGLGIFAMLIGVWFVGLDQISIGNRSWLRPTPGRLDHAVAQLNWEFLRWSDITQWPPFGLPNLGTGWNTVYVPFSSGSVVGMLLRYLSPALPQNFQFLGVWLVVSFFLLGYSAVLLVRTVTDDLLIQILGSLMMLSAPVFYYRIGVLGHFELSAHWLIFVAFRQLLIGTFKVGYWAFLLVVTLAINVYLFAIVAALFVGGLIQFLIIERKIIRSILELLFVVTTIVLSAWILGFFAYRSNAQGLGFFRLNAGAFFFPKYSLAGVYEGSFSRLFDVVGIFADKDFYAFEREGFGYLGFGVLIGAFVTIPILVAQYRKILGDLVTRFATIGVVAFLLFANAISNRIAFGQRELLTLPAPNWLLNLRQVFRTAERFSWPLYYLVFLTIILVLARLALTRAVRIGFLCVLLSIQIWDVSQGVVESRNALRTESQLPELTGPAWDRYIAGKTSVALVPVFDFIDDVQSPEIEAWRREDRYFSILELAARKRLSTNFSVTGRPVTDRVLSENRRLSEVMSVGRFDPKTLYVFPSRNQWSVLQDKFANSAEFMVLDGFYLIVPHP